MLTLVILLICACQILGQLTYSVVLIGGGLKDNNTEIWSSVISLGGGYGKARIGVISAASEDPCCDVDSSYTYYAAMLKLYGAAETYYIPVTIDTQAMNSDPKVIENIERMTGFIVGGGDQTRVIEAFYNGDDHHIESNALKAIKSTLESTGGVIAGTSAGTDCQTSKVMVAGGYSYDGLDKGVDLYDNVEDISSNARTVTAYSTGGIGIFTYGYIDTHYANRGRQGRSMALLMDAASETHSSKHAFGIDENTALLVSGDSSNRVGKVIGERSVFVLDSTYAKGTSAQSGRSITGMRASRLTHGDTIDLSTFKVTFDDYKSTLQETSSSTYTSNDIFESDYTFEFDKVVDSLLTSTASYAYGLTKEKLPRYRLYMDKTYTTVSGSNTVKAVGGVNPLTQVFEISYDGLWLSYDKNRG